MKFQCAKSFGQRRCKSVNYVCESRNVLLFAFLFRYLRDLRVRVVVFKDFYSRDSNSEQLTMLGAGTRYLYSACEVLDNFLLRLQPK